MYILLKIVFYFYIENFTTEDGRKACRILPYAIPAPLGEVHQKSLLLKIAQLYEPAPGHLINLKNSYSCFAKWLCKI